MSVKEKFEDQINKTEKKLKEFSISLKRLEQEYQEILKILNMTPEQIRAIATNAENYDPEVWELLQSHHKKMEERLKCELDSIPDPLETKKRLSEKGTIQQHWLFVR